MRGVVERVVEIERVVGTDVGRGIQRLVQSTSRNLLCAAEGIAAHPAPRIVVVTGFYIPIGAAAETDGPVGAALLAAALRENGIPTRVVTDALCRDAVAAALRGARTAADVEVYTQQTPQRLRRESCTHVISIERAGPAASGAIFNMSATDISATTPDMSALFENVPWTTIAVGDGGNEIGMGAVSSALIAEDIRHGEKIACVTPCHHLIVAGVSNWGAWGLLAALMLVSPALTIQPYLQTDMSWQILHTCVDEGPAVDGITGKKAYTVDGKDWDFHVSVLERILDVCQS